MNYDFWHPIDVSHINLNAALAQLESAELVRRLTGEEVAYWFKHALVQDTAYASLLIRERKHLHCAVGEVLERAYPDQLDQYAARLAQHYVEASDDAKTVEYATRAGDAAARLFAYPEARSHYALALDALARLPDAPENRRLRLDLLVKYVLWALFFESPTQNLARLEQAEALAQEFFESDAGVQLQLAQIYMGQGFMHLLRNEIRETLRLYAKSRALAQALHVDTLVANTTFEMGAATHFLGRFDEAEKLIREGILLLEQGGKTLYDVNTLAHLGYVLAARGFYTQGLQEGQRGLVLAQAGGNPFNRAVCYSYLALVFYMGGEMRQMLEAAQATIHFAEQSGNPLYVYVGNLLQAWASTRLGQVQVASESLAKATAIHEMFQGQLFLGGWLAAIKAESTFFGGDIEVALALAEQAAQSAHASDTLFIEGVAQRVWARALAAQDPPRWNEADTHFAESLRLFEAGDARLEAAHTHVAWGKILSARGENDAAREHLEKAAAQFEASGLTRELEETRTLISA